MCKNEADEKGFTSPKHIDDDQELKMSLQELLNYHEKLIHEGNSNALSSIKVRNKEDKDQYRYYLLKSISVKWKREEVSYMHMFIDTGLIKDLEKQEAINKCQNIMFSSVSHEFRTPINAFSNCLELVKISFDKFVKLTNSLNTNQDYKIIAENIFKYVSIGRISSKILLSLVEDILDLAKFESGTFSIKESPFRLNELISEFNEIFSLQCKQKRLDFQITCEENIKGLIFNSDCGRIKQILMNLLSNAFKFTQEGGIKVSISVEHRTLDFEKVKFLVFAVADTGVGISSQEIKNLFTMFSTINRHKESMNMRGTGLGLTISKKLTKMLGGKISVQSKEGHGSIFIFDIRESKCNIDEEMMLEVNSENNNSFHFRPDESEMFGSLHQCRASQLKLMNIHSSRLIKKAK